MFPRTDKGCGTPQNATLKQIQMRLVQLFAPLVYFEPDERFFPVDLSTTIKYSSLWKSDPKAQPPTSQRVKDVGLIDPTQDLAAATSKYYTTVAGTNSFLKTIEGQSPFNMPEPLLDAVYNKYADGTIPATLTMYATVCSAHDVTNSDLIYNPTDPDVKIAFQEGLIINYYMYFPAYEASEFKSEGDWAGISLLLKYTPTQLAQLNDSEKVKQFLPTLACYYQKTTDTTVGAPPARCFVAADQGFRKWKNVSLGKDQALGVDTHPIVYVSEGRHNCYYEPTTTNLKLYPPWEDYFTPEQIESGGYTAGPAGGGVLEGGGLEDTPIWVYFIFPPFALFVACATGCQSPWQFDSSGTWTGYADAEDQAQSGGYTGSPGATGSSYPKKAAGQVPVASRQVNLRLQYVDLTDKTTEALWGYLGAWGAASLRQYILKDDPSNPRKWGYYQGAHLPALGAWFVWNLFIDHQFGCRGVPETSVRSI